MRIRFWAVLVVACAMVASAAIMAGPASPASAAPAGFTITMLMKNINTPTNLEIAPDGRIFVTEMSGIIKVFDNVSDTTATVFADLRDQTFAYDNRGLLGLALDPRWATDPTKKWVYVFYAKDGPMGATPPVYNPIKTNPDRCPASTAQVPSLPNECTGSGRISRMLATTNKAGPEQILVEDWCHQWTSHGTGDLTFGLDGYLYASSGEGSTPSGTDFGQKGYHPNACGDPPTAVGVAPKVPTAEGGALRAQDVRTTGDQTGLAGAVIRIDPDTGLGAPGNPLAASSDLNARRMYSFGHRNPWRLTTRPGTNEIWIGEVGWDTWEEINRIATPPVGQPWNYGWPCFEGNEARFQLGLNLCTSLPSSAVQMPFYKYRHQTPLHPADTCPSSSSSVSGMAFYSGNRYPAEYQNALFFSDYAHQCVFVMGAGLDGLPDPTKLSTIFSGEPIVDLEAGPNGDIFMLSLYGMTGGGGKVYRISYPGGTPGPQAVAQATPASGAAPLTVNFTGASSLPGTPGDVLSYAWDLDGDNAFDDGSAVTASFTYPSNGVYTARLRVSDNHGKSSVTPVVITVGTPPVPTITTPATGTTWQVGDTLSFSGSATDNDIAMDASTLSWDLVLHHCKTLTDCHIHPLSTYTGVDSGTFAAPDHEYPAYLELRLTARATSGLSATTSLNLYPQTTEATLDSSPQGLQATIDGHTGTTPFASTVIAGSQHTIDVATPQTLSAIAYDFGSWSDLGSRVHDVSVGTSPVTYTATFAVSTGPTPALAYGFESISGTSVPDGSGGGRTGEVTGALPIADGKFGQALRFDGNSDYVLVPHDTALSGKTGFTVEAWVRPRITIGARTIVAKERFSSIGWALDQRTSTVARPSVIAKAATSVRATGSPALPANTWSHVAATWDQSTLKLYVNGTLATQRALTGSITEGIGPLRIGGNRFAASWFDGDLDEVRVYREALTAGQIATDMATPIGT